MVFHIPLLDMPHTILYGPPLSSKQSSVRFYLNNLGFPSSPKEDFKLTSNNFIYVRYTKNSSGTLFEFHWKDVFCNESILFSYLFDVLQNSYSFSHLPSYLVCYNIHLSSNPKTFQTLYKCIDKFPNIRLILTTNSLSYLPNNLIHRCQCISIFSSLNSPVISTSQETDLPSIISSLSIHDETSSNNKNNLNILSNSNNYDFIRNEIHKLLINNFNFNICLHSLLDHLFSSPLPESSYTSIINKANECSTLSINNEYYSQYILEHFVLFSLNIISP